MGNTVKNMDQFITQLLDQFLTQKPSNLGPTFNSTIYIYIYIIKSYCMFNLFIQNFTCQNFPWTYSSTIFLMKAVGAYFGSLYFVVKCDHMISCHPISVWPCSWVKVPFKFSDWETSSFCPMHPSFAFWCSGVIILLWLTVLDILSRCGVYVYIYVLICMCVCACVASILQVVTMLL